MHTDGLGCICVYLCPSVANGGCPALIMSKGHAAPLLYAMWAEAGFIPREHLTDLRLFTSNLEGHPTPRQPYDAVATGA